MFSCFEYELIMHWSSCFLLELKFKSAEIGLTVSYEIMFRQMLLDLSLLYGYPRTS